MASPPRPLSAGIPPELNQLIQWFSKIPGVGEKTATRYALGMVTDLESADGLGNALLALRASTGMCRICNYLSRPDDLCAICDDEKRNPRLLCVVHSFQDVIAFEQTQQMLSQLRGRYFVMGKLLSPLEGVGSDELPIKSLTNLVRAMIEDTRAGENGSAPVEVVLAMPPSVDGSATTLLLRRELRQAIPDDTRLFLSRIGQGVGHNSDLSYAGAITLGSALEERKSAG